MRQLRSDAWWRNENQLRSDAWFHNPDEPGETAIYLERYANRGITREELQARRPVIGIAQSGSELTPCNFIHTLLVQRVKDGIRDAGGLPIEFPVHPIQESARRPTAALDRNLSYLTLVEILTGYPFDGVVLTTGCDKTTPAALMAAATVDIPAIVLSGGPMLDATWDGRKAGSGMVIWQSRRDLAAGRISPQELVDVVLGTVPSAGHCNTMGTALSMNSLAEALGMSLPGCAAIPAPYAERAAMAYRTGYRAVELVRADLRPSAIMTRAAFENAIVVASAIGASTNCPPHLAAIAAHLGITIDVTEWDRLGYHIPLLVDLQPAGRHLGESFHRAGGVPAVIGELLAAGVLDGSPLTITGATVAENGKDRRSLDTDVIREYTNPVLPDAGFMVFSGNFADSAILKTSVISDDYRDRYLGGDVATAIFEVRAVVFDSPEDYRATIDDPALDVGPDSMLIVRNAGPVGYPGSAEVVNMSPPGRLVAQGIEMLPCLGDGRQSGTSDSPSFLNVSPEAAIGGGIALIRSGDRIRVDFGARRLDLLVSDEELELRRAQTHPEVVPSYTPWQEIYRRHVTQLSQGAHLDFATKYRSAGQITPRHSH